MRIPNVRRVLVLALAAVAAASMAVLMAQAPSGTDTVDHAKPVGYRRRHQGSGRTGEA